jgi:predicted lysophospholipase L1 biosynthesis ABC-type transport system permease subunit
MQPNGALLVVPEGALNVDPGAGLTYVWASGPPRQVVAALGRSSLSPSYLTVRADFSRTPDVANVTRTYGFLRIVAAAVVLLAFIALLLYLSGRERAQLVTSAFLRRMGLSQGRQALSVALEVGILVLVATVSGLAAALVTSGAIVGHVDPLAQYAPGPVADVPWMLLVAFAAVAALVAALVGAFLTLVVRRSDIGEALRVS